MSIYPKIGQRYIINIRQLKADSGMRMTKIHCYLLSKDNITLLLPFIKLTLTIYEVNCYIFGESKFSHNFRQLQAISGS